MTERPPSLPDFRDPPVVEVALGVEFQRLPLRNLHLGLLWDHFKVRFPLVEEYPPLDSAIEEFDSHGRQKPNVRVELLSASPVARHWFLNAARTRLIQVQQDRFVHNRRRVKDEEYPRYEAIRDTFKNELRVFQDFVAAQGLGTLKPQQCEVTYVNHIVSGSGWTTHGELGEILTVWVSRYSDDFLSLPEDVHLTARYVIPSEGGASAGRLHVVVAPTYDESGRAMYEIRLTARTRPGPEGDVLHALDVGREWIVRGFTSITSEVMHGHWGRLDDRARQ